MHQAVENVGDVMSNVLKVQQRMNGLLEKLTELGSTEATETFILYQNAMYMQRLKQQIA